MAVAEVVVVPEYRFEDVRGVQVPRVVWVPEYASSRGGEVAAFCADHGLVLDDWQVFVLERALGVRGDGKWAAFGVGLNVPRQNGKGAVLEARELAGIFLFGEQLITHSAHEFGTSMEAFERMEHILEEGGLQSELKPRGGVVRSHGAEGFRFRTGQRIRYRTRTKGGGRGFTADTVILDEAMILRPEFTGALIPTMSAKSVEGNPQLWYTGSAVDQMVHDHGLVFASVRERALRGDDPALAYFEWSTEVQRDGHPLLPGEVEAADLLDAARIAEANPGLGKRISLEYVHNEFRELPASSLYATERLGIGDYPDPENAETVIDLDLWDSLLDPQSLPADPAMLAFDVSEDRAWASIGAASWRDGRGHVEVVERRRGTGWVAGRLAEIRSRNRTGEVFYEGAGPASTLVADLVKEGVRATPVSATEHGQACGMFFDGVAGSELRHLGDARLRVALKGATRRTLGDSWAWSRRSSAVDISPLVAVSLAWWGARRKRVYRTGGFS